MTLSKTAVEATRGGLASTDLGGSKFLFRSQRGADGANSEHDGEDLVLVCGADGELRQPYAAQAWGYWQRMELGTAVPLLMEAFGHATQQQALAYLDIQAEEIAQIYNLEL